MGQHDWTSDQNEKTVKAYLEMLTSHFRDEPFRKVDFTRRVAEETGRSTRVESRIVV